MVDASRTPSPIAACVALTKPAVGAASQRTDPSGYQQEYWIETDPRSFLIVPVSAADGLPLSITVPMQPSNCAFGNADHKTLYITARTAVYSVVLANPGEPRR